MRASQSGTLCGPGIDRGVTLSVDMVLLSIKMVLLTAVWIVVALLKFSEALRSEHDPEEDSGAEVFSSSVGEPS